MHTSTSVFYSRRSGRATPTGFVCCTEIALVVRCGSSPTPSVAFYGLAQVANSSWPTTAASREQWRRGSPARTGR
jgi:hypothetical protein